MAIKSATDTQTNAADAASLSQSLSSSGGNSLGKDAFMKLLVAQIRHQDPLKPMDDTAFVSQLAQFSALEQALGTNQRLDMMSIQQKGVANTEVAALVGKSVTVKGDKVTLDGNGLAQPIHFTLGGNADQVTVSIKDASGKTVRTMQVGAKQAGLASMSWDGRDDLGTPQAAGAYTVSVQAKASGAAVDVSQESTGTLKSVSFEQGFAMLVLDNGVSAPASDLLRVNATTSTSK